jgi:hypothetical protein
MRNDQRVVGCIARLVGARHRGKPDYRARGKPRVPDRSYEIASAWRRPARIKTDTPTKKRNYFFLEKRNKKLLLFFSRRRFKCANQVAPFIGKSLLVLFFKKEPLPEIFGKVRSFRGPIRKTGLCNGHAVV